MSHHRLDVAKGFTLTHSQNPQNIFDAINFARLSVLHTVCDVLPSQIFFLFFFSPCDIGVRCIIALIMDLVVLLQSVSVFLYFWKIIFGASDRFANSLSCGFLL